MKILPPRARWSRTRGSDDEQFTVEDLGLELRRRRSSMVAGRPSWTTLISPGSQSQLSSSITSSTVGVAGSGTSVERAHRPENANQARPALLRRLRSAGTPSRDPGRLRGTLGSGSPRRTSTSHTTCVPGREVKSARFALHLVVPQRDQSPRSLRTSTASAGFPVDQAFSPQRSHVPRRIRREGLGTRRLTTKPHPVGNTAVLHLARAGNSSDCKMLPAAVSSRVITRRGHQDQPSVHELRRYPRTAKRSSSVASGPRGAMFIDAPVGLT